MGHGNPLKMRGCAYRSRELSYRCETLTKNLNVPTDTCLPLITAKERTIIVHTSCPGTVDQKNPLQSGSSNMYGTNRVNKRTQFKTANSKIKKNT